MLLHWTDLGQLKSLSLVHGHAYNYRINCLLSFWDETCGFFFLTDISKELKERKETDKEERKTKGHIPFPKTRRDKADIHKHPFLLHYEDSVWHEKVVSSSCTC